MIRFSPLPKVKARQWLSPRQQQLSPKNKQTSPHRFHHQVVMERLRRKLKCRTSQETAATITTICSTEQERDVGFSSLQTSPSPGPLPMMSLFDNDQSDNEDLPAMSPSKKHKSEIMLEQGDFVEEEDKVIGDVKIVLDVIKESQLTINKFQVGNLSWLVISPKDPEISSVGPINNPRFVVSSNGLYYLQAYYKTVSKGTWNSNNIIDLLEDCDKLKADSGYKVCPGVDIKPFKALIHHVSTLRKWGQPFERNDSQTCELFFKQRRSRLDCHTCCTSCRALLSQIKQQFKRAVRVTPLERKWRTSTSSKYKTLYLSPSSKRAKQKFHLNDRTAMIKSLKRYKNLDITLSPKQNQQMRKVTQSVNNTQLLNDIFTEAETKQGQKAKQTLKAIWKRDVEERLNFNQDQARNSNKHKPILTYP